VVRRVVAAVYSLILGIVLSAAGVGLAAWVVAAIVKVK
jgi:hypothetical protein